LTQSK